MVSKQFVVSIVVLLLLMLLSRFSRVRLCATLEQQPTRLLPPWDSPGKNTGVGCHFLLQCMKVKGKSEVAQSCPTVHDPMDRSLPGSSAEGIFQAWVLEWVAIAFSPSWCRPVQKLLRHIQWYFFPYSTKDYKLYTFERGFRKDSWEYMTSESTDILN